MDAKRTILFTGHMIDAKDRAVPRFPASKEKKARHEIFKHLIEHKEKSPGGIRGIASGACGGDTLFHEVCEDLNIPTEMYLPLPPEEFKKGSVSFAGRKWEKRFNKLTRDLPVHVLPDPGENIYEQVNRWMLDVALKEGGEQMILLALWDRKKGDGKGGTQHMIEIAEKQGSEIDIIDINVI